MCYLHLLVPLAALKRNSDWCYICFDIALLLSLNKTPQWALLTTHLINPSITSLGLPGDSHPVNRD